MNLTLSMKVNAKEEIVANSGISASLTMKVYGDPHHDASGALSLTIYDPELIKMFQTGKYYIVEIRPAE